MTLPWKLFLILCDIPSTPSISSNRNPYVGEDVILTCSSSHTTQPNNHSLSMRYDWQVDGDTNPTGNKYEYTTSGENLTVKNVGTVDVQKSFICSATELVTDGYTSLNSQLFNIDVLYGPDSVQLSPATNSYIKNEGEPLVDITCSSDCFPDCTYSWSKDGGGVGSNNGVLSLGTLQRNERGAYTCRAVNPERQGQSQISPSVTLIVRYGPDSVQLYPGSYAYTHNEGKLFGDITCLSNCFPVCTFSWSKVDGGVVSDNSVLRLRTLQRNEAGAYTCTAVNPERQGQSQTSGSVTVNVRYGPDSVQLSPATNSYIKNEGEPLVDITCSSDCFPDCTYSWSKDGGGVGSNNGVLSLGTLQRNERGAYTCRAVNPERQGQSQISPSVTLIVRYGPDSVQLYPDSYAYTHNEGKLFGDITCLSNCFPVCTFSWSKVDGGVVSDNSVLRLRTLQRNEAGAYTCTAVNPERQGQSQTSGSVTVNVRYGPDESVFNVNSPYYLMEGQEADDIICSSTCWPGCRNTLYNDSSNTPIGNNGHFSFGAVSRHTSGNYTCQSENTYNGFQKSSSKTLQLFVYYLPSAPGFVLGTDIIESPCPIVVTEGTNLSVKCVSFDDNPMPYQYTWTLPDGTTRNGQQLEILNIQTLGNNIYTCTAQNTMIPYVGTTTAGSKSSAVVVLLQFSPRPSLYVPLVTNISAQLNTSGMLSFIAMAYPVPESSDFIWQICKERLCENIIDGDVTSISTLGLATNLTIHNVMRTNIGRYKLVVSNGIGNDFEQDYFVILQDRPNIPTQFDYLDDSITTSSVTLVWNPGFNGGLPQTFVIQYKPLSDQGQWTSNEVADQSDGIMHFTLNKLQSDTDYTSRMFAYNAVNQSDVTAEIMFKTNPEDVPKTTALIGGIVGGCIGAVVVIAAIVAILLIRKRRQGMPKNTSNESEASAYTELNVTRSASTVYDPIQISATPEQTDDRTEPSNTSTQADLTEYGNIQNTHELGSTGNKEQTQSKLYANA